MREVVCFNPADPLFPIVRYAEEMTPLAYAGEFVTREDTCEVICRLANDIYVGAIPCVEDFCCWTIDPPTTRDPIPLPDPKGSQFIRFNPEWGVDLHLMTGWLSQTR